ncbi:MAG: ABC transporter permease [Anaerolineae bacterium]|nr:ABC transporter permease [Anaerolineae bacterium]
MKELSTSRTLMPFLFSLLAIVFAFLVGAIFLWLLGKEPLAAYSILISRGLGTTLGISETLVKMAPLLIVSAGLLIALKASVWNIGIDGQFLVGAALVGVVAPMLAGNIPLVPLLIISALVGFAGGMLWGVVPAVLKVRYGLNEIITTIMMNFVAIFTTSWLVKGPFKDPSVVAPQMPTIPREFRLPALPAFNRVHVGILVGIVAVLLVYFLFRSGTLGFKLSVLGQSKKAAIHAGLRVNMLTVLALLLSAGMAGLAGANDVLGVKGLFQGEWNPQYGLTAFALVFLARLNGLLVIPFAFFFAFLLFGGEMMARTAKIPAFYVPMLEGLILIFFAISMYFERKYLDRSESVG